MNRKRIFGIIFVLIFLLILIVQNVGANDDDRLQAQLSSSNTLIVNADSLYNYRNLYCVDENQKFEEILTGTGNHEYKAVAIAEIEGRYATFTNLKDTNAEKVNITSNANNIMAALLSRNDIFGEGYSSSKTSTEYTKAQQGLYGYYNTWINETGATEFGFETSIGNETIENLDENEILSVAKTYGESHNTYRVKIYFLKYNTSDESKIANTQNIILVEIGKATADIYVSKTWWSWQNSQSEVQVGEPVKINATLEIVDKKSGALIEDISSIKDIYGEPIVDENGNLIDINGNDVKEIFELKYRAEDVDKGNSQQSAIVAKEEFERIYKGEPRENVDLSKYVVKNLRVLPDEYIYKVYQSEALEYINSDGEICEYTDENKESIYTKNYKYQSKNNENVHATPHTWGAGTIDKPISIQSVGTITLRILWDDYGNRSNQRPELVNLNFYKGEGDNEEFIKTAIVQSKIERVPGAIQENLDWSGNGTWLYSFAGNKIINPSGNEADSGLDIYDENGNYINYRYEIDETIEYPLEEFKKTLEKYGYKVDYENAIDEKISDYLSDIKRRTIKIKRCTDYVYVGVKIDWQDDNNRDGKRPKRMVVQVNDGQFYRYYPEIATSNDRLNWQGKATWWTHAKIGEQWVAQADIGTVSNYVPTDAWWDYVKYEKEGEDVEEIPVNMRIWIRNGNGVTTGNQEKGTSYSPPLLEELRDWVDIEEAGGKFQESLLLLDDSNGWTYSGMHLYRFFGMGMDKQFKVVLNTELLGDGYECENSVNYFSCATDFQLTLDGNDDYSEGVGWIPEDPNTYKYFPKGRDKDILTENIGDTELIPKEEFYKKFDDYVEYDPERQKLYLETYSKDVYDRFGNPAEKKTFNLIHSYEPEKVQIPVTKVWDDNNNAKGMRPKTIKVALYADDKDGNKVKVQEREITGDATAEKWEYTFTSYKEDGSLLDYSERLFKYRDGGTLITYTAEEEEDIKPYDKISITPENITGNRDKDEGDEDEVTSGFSLTNKYVPQYIEIKGTVWEDGEASNPNNNINGKMEPKDKKLSGIKVRICDGNKNSIKLLDENYQEQANNWEETDSKGEYTLIIEEQDLKDAYVEFIYDGMTYTTVQIITGNKYLPTSKAVENKNQRMLFDQTHSIVTPGTLNPEKWKDKEITASTNNVIDFKNDELYSEHPDKDNVKRVKDINLGLFVREQPDVAISMDISKVEVDMNNQKYTYLYGIKNQHILEAGEENNIQAKFQDKKTNYTYQRPVNPADIGYAQANDGNIEVYVTYEISVANQSNTLTTVIDSIANFYDSNYQIKYVDKNVDGEDATERYHITYGLMNNEGKIDGTPLEASQISELDAKEAKKGYSEITLSGLGIQLTAKSESANKIYIRYKVKNKLKPEDDNNSNIIGLFKDEPPLNNAVEIYSYYTLYSNDTLYAEKNKGRTKIIYGNMFNKNFIDYYAGYDIDSCPGNANIQLRPEDKPNRMYSIDQNGQIIPDDKIEDDTDIAPAFVLCLSADKALSGIVWEDTDVPTEENDPRKDERLGNGYIDRNPDGTMAENAVENVKVELYELDEENSSYKPATLYTLNKSTGNVEKTENAHCYTKHDGTYEFVGIVTNKEYYIRYTYGNVDDEHRTQIIQKAVINESTEDLKIEVVNARNYKSTIIKDKIVKDIFLDGDSYDKNWILNPLRDDDYSVAVDYIEDTDNSDEIYARLEIENLKYNNFDLGVNMTAYTKSFMIPLNKGTQSVEKNEQGEYIVTEDSEEKYNLNFGIIERPREDLVVEKTITDFKLKLSNGMELITGNPSDPNSNMPYTKKIGFVDVNLDNIKKVRNRSYKLLSVELDTELIQGAQLEVKYKLEVINNNEIDYDYKTGPGKDYYYYGTIQEEGTELPTTIQMVDYMTRELALKDYTGWEIIGNSENLETAGFISEDLKNGINKYGYQVLRPLGDEGSIIEIARKETWISGEITATKTLTNKDENTFDNNTEIIEIDGKTARTVKAREDNANETTKRIEYKPGNFSDYEEEIHLNKHGINEQDEDIVKIVITPPTGITNNIITYTIIGLIVLIVMLVGIIFIKKKSLNK